jgi:hypothetical protein
MKGTVDKYQLKRVQSEIAENENPTKTRQKNFGLIIVFMKTLRPFWCGKKEIKRKQANESSFETKERREEERRRVRCLPVKQNKSE